jgi:F0F1-type ATP synthase membrane subunit b/b'
MAQPRKRVTSDITDINELLQQYPQYAQDIDSEAWEMLTDAQKLVYLAKKQLNQVKGKSAKQAG